MFRRVCDNDGKLLFKIDPMCGIIEIQRRGVRTYVNLTRFGMKPAEGDAENQRHNDSDPGTTRLSMM